MFLVMPPTQPTKPDEICLDMLRRRAKPAGSSRSPGDSRSPRTRSSLGGPPRSSPPVGTQPHSHSSELPEAADFQETTSLTVEELSDGIRCFTVRPIHSQRLGLPLLAGSFLCAALSTSLPPPLIVFAVLFALGVATRAAFSVHLESLLVMDGIGLQLTTRFASGREKVVFVETSAVSEVRSSSRRHARMPRRQSTRRLYRCSSVRRCGWTAASSTWRAYYTATTNATSQGAPRERRWGRVAVT